MASETLDRAPAAVDPDKLNAFMGKMVGDMGAAMSAALVILGDRLGIYRALAEPGPALLHVAIDARANVWPLVPPNTANSTMLESNPAHARQEIPNAIPA